MVFNFAVEYAIDMLSFLHNNVRALHYATELKANYAQFTNDTEAYDEVMCYGEIPGELARLLILAFDQCLTRLSARVYHDYALWALIARNYLVKLLQNSVVCVLGLRRYRYTALDVFPKNLVKLIAYEIWNTRKTCSPKSWERN